MNDLKIEEQLTWDEIRERLKGAGKQVTQKDIDEAIAHARTQLYGQGRS